MLIKNEYERLRGMDAPLDRLLGELDLAYLRRFAGLNAFFTCTLIDLDIRNHELSVACGGHPEQYVYSGGEIREFRARGAVVGAFEKTRFAEIKASLRPADRLLMFSDGIEELRGPDDAFYGVERLRASVLRHGPQTRSAAEFVRALIADAHGFRGAAPATDDVTLIAAIVP
jgi:serine phosphatase RsbU (regulator of sigma subunit)